MCLPSHPDIHTASGQLSGFGAVCYVAVIAIGVPTDVRINKQTDCPLVNRESTIRLGRSACTLDSFSRDPHSFFRSGVCSLRGNYDFRKYLKFFSRFRRTAFHPILTDAQATACWSRFS